MNKPFKPPQTTGTDAPRQISGAWSWPGSGGGGGDEKPNTLKSSQTARIVDLLGEGPIVGPWDGLKSIYLDGLPVVSKDDEDNFDNYTIAGVNGWPNQPMLKGFAAQQQEVTVNEQLKSGITKTHRIDNPDTDRCRVTVSTPALMKTKKKGKVKGSHINFVIRVQTNNGGYKLVTNNRIEGKTNTRYQRQLIFDLPTNESPSRGAPWDIQLERLTEDSDELDLQNELYWDSYTEIIDAKVNYTLSAVMGYTVRAEDFNSIPQRVIDCGGLLIRYPSNYDPEARTYHGAWDGTFLTGFCNNPAWVFYDLVIEGRYGIGDFIDPGDVDKWELYSIAQWCDGRVPIEPGRSEPRWTFNGRITDQQEAYDLLANVASVWRGSAFWANGQLTPTCDKPADPVFNFTNANVVDGQFNYQSADRRARHNQVAVAWEDPANLGQRRLAIVEDKLKSIAKNGVLRTDVVAMGCTSESMAMRVGEWLIYTENYEADTTTFTAGLEGAYVRPGHIAMVSDVNVSGSRRAGRLAEVHADYVILDAPVTLRDDVGYFLTAVRPNGNLITVKVHYGSSPTARLNLNVDWGGSWPEPDSNWSLASDDIEPSLWRVLSAKKNDVDKYDIAAVSHNPGKWGYIERDKKLSFPDISNIGGVPGITGTQVSDYLYALSPISVGVKMLIAWQSRAPYFDLAYREEDGPWTRMLSISQHSIEVDADEDIYDIWITPRNELGQRGQTTKLQYEVIGRTEPPLKPENFRIQNVNGVALLQWKLSDELDMIIGGSYELRYSPRTTDATWASANKVITSIPGTATTAELPYRPGTYLLKAKDITGLTSPVATIIATAPNKQTRQYIKISEQPTFLGTHDRTTILMPQQWLIIADPNLEGFYKFKNQIDMGAVFPVTLTVDMFAFPYIEGAGFIDDRLDNIDTWQSFDDAGGDGEGMVTIQLRQTNVNPATALETDWTAWTQFIAGDYEGRGFQFRAWLAAPEGQNVGIEELAIIADVTSKQDQGNDRVWAGPSMNIVYAVKFYSVPSVAINIQNAATGDYYKVTNKTTTGFKLELFTGSNAAITTGRTFDWIASGY